MKPNLHLSTNARDVPVLPLENCGESSIFAWHSWHSRTRPPLFASGRDEPRRRCVGGGGDQLWIVVKVDLTLRLQPQLFLRRRDLISLAAPIASNGNKSARDCTATRYGGEIRSGQGATRAKHDAWAQRPRALRRPPQERVQGVTRVVMAFLLAPSSLSIP